MEANLAQSIGDLNNAVPTVGETDRLRCQQRELRGADLVLVVRFSPLSSNYASPAGTTTVRWANERTEHCHPVSLEFPASFERILDLLFGNNAWM